MTLITFQDGKPVMRDGKIGTEQDCCCQPGGCSCDQVDIAECADSFTVTFEAFDPSNPTCVESFTVDIEKQDLQVPADGVVDGWQKSDFMQAPGSSVGLFCQELEGGSQWLLQIGMDGVGATCAVLVASVEVVLGSVCGCPEVGTFTVEDAYGRQTTVTIA